MSIGRWADVPRSTRASPLINLDDGSWGIAEANKGVVSPEQASTSPNFIRMTSLADQKHTPPRRRSKDRRTLYWIIAGAGTLAVIAGALAGPVTSRVEQPAYRVLKSDGSFEVRAYDPLIAAEVTLHGAREAALSQGFQRIAAYIFGANQPRAKIAMTAPVEQQGVQKIAMTAPVSQQADGDAWIVRFIMPRGSSLETLPSPDDAGVMLKPVDARTMLVIRFSGIASASLIGSKTDELRHYAMTHRIETVDEPLIAFYNPPWTLPFLRRNEVMLQVKQA